MRRQRPLAPSVAQASRGGATNGGTNLCQSTGHHGLTGGSSPPAGTVVVVVAKAIGLLGGCLCCSGSKKISDDFAFSRGISSKRDGGAEGPNGGPGPREGGAQATWTAWSPAPPARGALARQSEEEARN